MPLDLSSLLASPAALQVVELFSTGERLFALDINHLGRVARVGDGQPPAPASIAILPLNGALTPRGSTGMEGFAARLNAIAANPDVGAIVLDVNSPGGTVARTAETAAAVRAAAQVKPVIALADTLMASAAYWIGCQATQLWVTPSGEVGSIGVRGLHGDVSRMLDAAGITMTEITSGAYKGELSPFSPLSEDARANVQAEADAQHELFIQAVAQGRKTSQANVRENFGQGRTVGADRAVQLGMADRVGTMADLLDSLRTKSGAVRRRTALAFG